MEQLHAFSISVPLLCSGDAGGNLGKNRLLHEPLCLFQAYLGCLVHVAVVHFDDFFMDISCHCYDPRHCPLPSDGTASCWQLYLCKGRGLHEQSVVLISPWSGFVEMSVQLLIADFQNFHGDLLPLL